MWTPDIVTTSVHRAVRYDPTFTSITARNNRTDVRHKKEDADNKEKYEDVCHRDLT